MKAKFDKIMATFVEDQKHSSLVGGGNSGPVNI